MQSRIGPFSMLVATSLLVVGSSGACSAANEPGPPELAVETTILEPAPVPPVRELDGPAEVEAFVREFGECAVSGIDDVAIEIGFDAATGFVGGLRSVARTSEQSAALDLAKHVCNQELGYRASVDAYALAHPDAAEFIPSGLEPAAGRRLTFGDESLLAE